MKHKKAILLFGPTTSGKSGLAVEIAKKFKGEIINADSMQVYKEIKILSARPDEKGVKHHLYGFISVKKNFSVGQWYKLASKKIKEVNKKNKIAIVVGGTGLYFKALIEGLVDMPEIPKKDYKLNPMNRDYLINHYSNRYPGIFDNINLNDTQRLYRAISVYEHTGITLANWHSKKNKIYFNNKDFIKICLIPPKLEIEKRIKKRFIDMLENGALKEAKNFYRLDVWKNELYTSNFIIGLREIDNFLNKLISMDTLKKQVLIRTRQYAKRQYTWQKGQMKGWKGFTDTNYLNLRKKVLSYLSKT
jgi:tRNA dimethylallyltransferase